MAIISIDGKLIYRCSVRNIMTTHLIAYEESVTLFCELSQPQRILSGLGKTFIKRYVVEWTNNKAELGLEEESEKVDSH